MQQGVEAKEPGQATPPAAAASRSGLVCPLTGAALVALGGIVICGWLLRERTVVQVIPGVTAMVFNTAASFVLAGIALAALDAYRPRAAQLLSVAVLLLAAATQAQHLFGTDFGIDWPSLHDWLADGNRHPGRTSLVTSAGFTMFGIATILAARGEPGRAWLPRALAGLLALLAAANLAAYLFSLDDLLGALRFPRMGVLTACGALVLGLALPFSRPLRAAKIADADRFRERIVSTAALLLVSISGLAGLATLAVMENRLRGALSDALLARLEERTDLLEYILRDAERGARSVANRPGLLRNMREMARSGHALEANLEFMRADAQSFREVGFTVVELRNAEGQVLVRSGERARPMRAIELLTLHRSVLLWDGRMLLRTELEMRDGLGLLGFALVEQPLPDFMLLSADAVLLGQTGEIALCSRDGPQLRCFPTRLNRRPFDFPAHNAAGEPLPMTLALTGKSGVIRAQDYRRQPVTAAYAPVGELGLGMVLKMDTAEIYAPIRKRALLGIALLAVLVAAGTLLLRARIRPLVARLVRAEDTARESAERLHLALQGSGAALWDNDIRTGEVVLSERWAEMIGAPPGATRTTVTQLAAMVHPDDLGLATRNSRRALSGEISEYATEHRVRALDGRWVWILSRGKVVERDPENGHALRMAGTNTDIGARKAAEERMRHLAHYDALTGCANRVLFADRLRRALARSRRGGAAMALLYLDVDRFKAVNDRLGHAAGDDLLKAFAQRVQGCVRETDTVGRLGGDEFAVLLEGLTGERGAEVVAQHVLDAMRAPLRAGEEEIVVTTSIGGAVLRDASAEDAESLARRADAALYAAKAAGRNTFRMDGGKTQ